MADFKQYPTMVVYKFDGTDYIIPFEFLARKFINVTLISLEGDERRPLVLGIDYRYTERATIRLINITDMWGAVEIARNTSARDRLVSFADGSILRSTDLNVAQIQTIHVAEEARAQVDTLLRPSMEEVRLLAGDARDSRDKALESAAWAERSRQQAEAYLKRSIRVPEGEEYLIDLPKASERAGMGIAFDENGQLLVTYPSPGSAAEVMVLLSRHDGAGRIGGVARTVKTLSELLVSDCTLNDSVTAVRLAADSPVSPSSYIKVPELNDVAKSGTYWATRGLTNGRPVAWDSKGNAFMMRYTINQCYTVEALGGGLQDPAKPDTEYLELAQKASMSPVVLHSGKTYHYNRPVNHTGCPGYIGNGATIKAVPGPNGNKAPYITAKVRATGSPLDTANGTEWMANAIFDGVVFDCDYTDRTGKAGFEFGEMTLNAFTNTMFVNCQFKYGKFDNVALQNGCKFVIFESCQFLFAGEDAVTVRHTCERITFRNCRVWDTAWVAKNGVAYGDGIVVKGQMVVIDGCHFKLVGGGIKGAGIANNAEDTDTVYQASYGIFTNNLFERCYGGIGIGTVKPEFINNGQYIEGMIVTNNVFIDTTANAIGIRQAQNVECTSNIIKGQAHSGYFAVEFIDVINLVGQASARSAAGGGLLIRSSNGTINYQGTTVSTAGALNGVTLQNCDGLTGNISVTDVNREGISLENIRNSTLNLMAKQTARSGVGGNSVTRCVLNIMSHSAQRTGSTFDVVFQCKLTVSVYDSSLAGDGVYQGVRLTSGSGNLLEVVSHHSQANRPSAGLSFGGSVRGTGYNVVTSGSHTGVAVDSGAIVTKGIEVK